MRVMSARQAVIHEAVKDLYKMYRPIKKDMVKTLQFGRNNTQHIDSLMRLMGKDIEEWWFALDPPYRSLIRRMIWERFIKLLILKEK